MLTLRQFIDDFSGLFFPRLCVVCGKSLFSHEEYLCNPCWLALPKTNSHRDNENPVARTFWGRAWIQDAAACYYYSRGNRVQHVIHQIKYKGEEQLGEFLGEHYGYELKEAGFLTDANFLIPVPLHPKKQKQRGYNQSEAIARGLSHSMGLEMVPGHLYRTKATATQTRKSRYSRWENVENIFGIRDPAILENKHVVIVDDVITTGSTLEACIEVLQTVKGVKVSVLALAYSSR